MVERVAAKSHAGLFFRRPRARFTRPHGMAWAGVLGAFTEALMERGLCTLGLS
jgi:hypothetical protein